MIDDKDKDLSDNQFPEDDTFGDENFDLGTDEFSLDEDDDDDVMPLENDDSDNISAEYNETQPHAPDDAMQDTSFETSDEPHEDVFEGFDDEDDPFELTDEDDTFDASTENDSGDGSTQGAPVKLIAGFAAAVAFGFITWQAFSTGASDDVQLTQAQNETAEKAPVSEKSSELSGLFVQNTKDQPTASQNEAPKDKANVSANRDTSADKSPPSAQEDSSTQTQVASTTPSDASAKSSATEPTTVAQAPPAPVKAEVDLSSIESLLQEYNETMSARMRRVESNLRSVTDDLDDINRNLGNMSDQVSGMGHLVSNMSGQFQMLGSSQDTDRKEMARQEMFANPTLHVHAIIPGRAWLKKHDGGILTVSEGDLLGEYGKVLAIDASSAAVITSSGVTLR